MEDCFGRSQLPLDHLVFEVHLYTSLGFFYRPSAPAKAPQKSTTKAPGKAGGKAASKGQGAGQGSLLSFFKKKT